MIKRAAVILAAAAAFYILLATVGIAYPHASTASTQPVGSSTVSLGSGYCLTTAYGSDLPGTRLIAGDCNPAWQRDQFYFANGLLEPWASHNTVNVNSAGQLVLGSPAGILTSAPTVWTYGPGHELTTVVNGQTEYLTWLVSQGNKPRVSAVQGPGQVVYILEFLGS